MNRRELYRLRRGRNLVLALILLALVVIFFIVSVTKMQMGVEQKRATDPARQDSAPPTTGGTKQ